MKLCKENYGVQLSRYILKLSIFSCQHFCNSCSFSLFQFLIFIFLLQISFSKPIQNVIIKTKKSVATNIVASKKYHFLIFGRLDLVVVENCARM